MDEGREHMHPIIEVNHKKLLKNLEKIQKLNTSNAKIMAVIKSNAYGHGMIEIAKTLSFQVDCFGVGLFSEALMLREQGIIQEILVLGPTYNFALAMEHKITITIESSEQGQALMEFIQKNIHNTKKKINIHIKVDTGFGRFGFAETELENFLQQHKKYSEYIVIKGVYSHIATTKRSNDFNVQKQNERFLQLKKQFESLVDTQNILFHIANSEITIDYPNMHYDMIRIGNALFGPVNSQQILNLNRIVTLKFPVVSIHERARGQYIGYGLRYRFKHAGKIGIVQAGFYEGIGIEKSPIGQNKIHQIRFSLKKMLKAIVRNEYVLYQNTKLPIIGMINMQYTCIDISEVNIQIGDTVELLKSPLYFKENIERRHILEDNNGISNES